MFAPLGSWGSSFLSVKELLFEPSADAALTALEGDRSRERLRARAEAALRHLAAHSEDARSRRYAYTGPARGMWGMPVRSEDDEWLILWLPGPGEDESTVVYVGPAP